MLKNKEERKAFIQNNNNWNLVYEHQSIHTSFYELILPDGTIVLREEVNEFDEFNKSLIQRRSVYVSITYRICRPEYLTCSISMSALIELLGKIKEGN